MAFGRGLIVTFTVALFGVIVLHVLPDASGAGADALKNVAQREVAVDAFRTLFLATAALLTLSLATLTAMEEQPLKTKRAE